MPVGRLSSPAALSLIVLVLQNSVLVVMTRYSRLNVAPKDRYYTSTMVLNQEIVKMVLCIVIFILQTTGHRDASFIGKLEAATTSTNRNHNRNSDSGVWRLLWSVIFQEETLRISVPAALFTLQNYLLFIALSHLDVMTFQVWSQTKLLFAALFSLAMLGRHLSVMQWCSLFLLTLGVLFTQGDEWGAKAARISSQTSHNRLLGIAACVLSGISSSYAGVYFEKIVKTTAPSLAVRNIHLSLFGIPFAALSMFFLDVFPSWYDPKGDNSDFCFWRGYDNWLTIALVAVHALGGLLVAAVVKYADNILKGFATGMAVVVSGVFSFMIWGNTPSTMFVCGCFLITASGVLYHKFDERMRPRSLLVPALSQ